MRKNIKYFLSVVIIFNFINLKSQNNEKVSSTDYYTIAPGLYNNTTTVWSLTGYAGLPCGCAPSCNLPANTTVHINKLIIATCNPLDIGSNRSEERRVGKECA